MMLMVLISILYSSNFLWADCTLSFSIQDSIGPATLDYLERGIKNHEAQKCSSVLLKINTPGGSLQTTRKIIELILASPQPFLCLVYPEGGHAGSAGAILLQACHVSGALPATNLGAASPVSGDGQSLSEDMRKKIFEDTKSWVEGLARYHGRNVEFASQIVTNAKALDALSALKVGAIDTVVNSIPDFLDFASRRQVNLKNQKVSVVVGEVHEVPTDLRHDFLQFFSNPQLVYLIFMGSLGLLYFELTHPGAIVPGVLGALGLILSLVNFHMLEVYWGGVALIALGIAFLFAEIFVPSFGALGVGGLSAMIMGSLFLFDEQSGYSIPLGFLLAVTLLLFTTMAGLSYLAWQAVSRGERRRKKSNFIGELAIVQQAPQKSEPGLALLHGEIWKIESHDVLKPHDKVKVIDINGLTLRVKRID